MEKEELVNIIKALQNNNSKDNAGLGFYSMDNGDGETYIKANKAGLELFAAELLNASSRIEEMENGKIDTLYINVNNDWIENQISLMYIQPVIDFERKKIEDTIYSWKDSALKYGCSIFIMFAVISIMVGAFTIIRWLL